MVSETTMLEVLVWLLFLFIGCYVVLLTIFAISDKTIGTDLAPYPLAFLVRRGEARRQR
ncbi:hypothetical protein SAMN04488498_1773 [Mesorhizobium albiziae]|uniref:Uncharacterized protein n=1 Tax=Neomesorhizobium albiziae TaxID=335020 RepID=A0A1I4G2Z4_9HYPH|nr:hypothetical protein [Mesorhizobium albiziae]GLS34122.1 hypothetical protein GCM10007937_58360 [Mesorhizobium albiziae]SFL24109.1 hypothetical protein SAMN04488498_1773 [Mesorhizobium albiziae]